MDLLGIDTSETNMDTCYSNPNIHWPPNQHDIALPNITYLHTKSNPHTRPIGTYSPKCYHSSHIHTSEYKLIKQYQTQQLNDIEKLKKWPARFYPSLLTDYKPLSNLHLFSNMKSIRDLRYQTVKAN